MRGCPLRDGSHLLFLAGCRDGRPLIETYDRSAPGVAFVDGVADERYNLEVLFGNLSPQEAAEQLTADVEDMLE
ncbi:hypothetical protein AA0Y32_10630 [Georgenia phoenicis]|uniref:hypothetical protein n=1 Tax=unclassified Georgenia TaxID=2626815 RepID=UPI0039AFDBE2